MVVLVPEPVIVTFPGLRVSSHDPEGSELNRTLPVETAQVGWVIVVAKGGERADDPLLITTFAEGREGQPDERLTVKVYVPGESPEMVTLRPEPIKVSPPGYLINIHEASDGRL